MTRLTLMLMIVAAICGYAYGIECREDSCFTVRCGVVTSENCNGTIIEGGGYCGCCDSCARILNPGDSCSLPVTGDPQTESCPRNYYCSSRSYTCQRLAIS